jgi:phenylalanyl-tRNA synthetase beta subunit
MVSENLFEGELSEAVTIQNPLAEDMVYMRRTLIPSLLLVVGENKSREDIKIFELSNIYEKRDSILPDERLHLAGIIKKPHISFFEVKGIFEQLAKDLEITHLLFKPVDNGSSGAEIYIESEKIGDIEILDKEVIDFEIDFGSLIKYATAKKTFIPLAKYPPIIEDMTFIISDTVTVGEIINSIKKQSELIRNVSLFDRYKDTRTFRITYQHAEKNLTTADVAPVREKISKTLKETLHLQIK